MIRHRVLEAIETRGDVLGVLMTRAVVLVSQLTSLAVLARSLGPVGKGHHELIVLAVALSVVVGGMGLPSGIVFHRARGDLEDRDLVGASVIVALIGPPLVLLPAGLLYVALMRSPGPLPAEGELLLFAALSAVTELLFINLRSILQGRDLIARSNVVHLVRSVATTAWVIGFVGVGHGGVAAALAAFAFGGAVAAWTCLRVLSVQVAQLQLVPSLRAIGAIYRYSVRSVAANAAQWLNYRLDVFVVGAFLGARAVGVYAIAVRVAELLWQLPNAVAFVLLPRTASSGSDRGWTLARRAALETTAITAMLALVLAAVGRPGIAMVFGEEYAGAYLPMVVLLPGVVALGTSKILTSYIGGRGRPGLNSLISAGALVVTLIADFALIPAFGLLGAALASTVAYLLTVGAALSGSRHSYRRERIAAEADRTPL